MDGRFTLESIGDGGNAHLVGIGGAGMSAIATVLVEMGYAVEGSDIKESSNVRRLREMGVVVGIGHRAKNLSDARVVVKSAAIRDDNPELVEAEQKGVPVITRAQMLAAIMSTRRGIAVAGTHGKTTTSSLATQMLLDCRSNPSYLIGGELNEIGGNAHYGDGEYLVAEADESDGSLLHLRPEVAVLTNIDGDHLDYFESIENTAEVFLRFLQLLPPGGFAVVCGDDELAREVGLEYRREEGRVLFYGRSSENEYRFSGEVISSSGTEYAAWYLDERLGDVVVGIPGLYNAYNSLAALAVGHQVGLPMDQAIRGLGSFQGVRRRYERIGSCGGVQVIDDYAHHPTEIAAVLDLAGSVAPGRVVTVFQPHRYTRTRLLADQFGGSFGGADLIVVTDVYGAGEDPEPGVTGKLVADGIAERYPGKEIVYVPNRGELAAAVASLLDEGDTVITIGAGDITQCASEILEILEEKVR
ncbi:MAG: UDP-N-acetylmuramate--L-alanine ligase [Actinobacteria bacterium]|nr:UDP-N-acetylmuramate--L-alanine ligase [Actinomycetota bacterium]MBU4489573.1 UDP-N-acetylmuramate--L-alanine ligase [Actinomycetota bacterium]MCG2795663.1 UDP-N-acetylmuramate--L-alanine ligase [Actinomycetes bacterium]